MFGHSLSERLSETSHGGLLRKQGTSGSLASEDDDLLTSVSRAASMRDQRSSVIGLRDRLLKEARSERQRCLENAEAAERRKCEVRGACEASTQTDPVVISDFGNPSASASIPTVSVLADKLGLTGGRGAVGSGLSATWTLADEEAQAEALRTIQTLGQIGAMASRQTEAQRHEAQDELRAERANRQELAAQASHERSRKEAAQQQVLCLEYELDGKEAALQVAERALERRDADLQQSQEQLRSLQVSQGSAGRLDGPGAQGPEDQRCRSYRVQLQEKERQLEMKDQHISRLLAVLRQHRGGEEESTMCPTASLGGRSVTTSGLAH